LVIQPDLGRVPVSSSWDNDEVSPLFGDPTMDEVPGKDLTMLIANETATGAEHFLSWIEQVFEGNEFFRFLFWELCPRPGVNVKRWNQKEMLLPGRGINRPEATIETIGVGGAAQGRHYRIQIKDDLVGKNAMESLEVMAKTREWVTYSDSIFVNPTTDIDLFVGTRWARGDIYDDYFRDGRYAVFTRRAIEDGRPLFPEEFSLDFFNHIAKRRPFYFRSQYQNDPRGEGAIDLDSARLQRYELRRTENDVSFIVRTPNPNGGADLIERIMLGGCFGAMSLDPSHSENLRTGSRKAILVCARDWKGRTFVIDGWTSRGSHDEMFDAAFRLYERYGFTLGIETVAFQKFLLWAFKKEERRRRQWISKRALLTSTKKTKVERIRSTIQNDLNLELLYVPESGMSPDFQDVIQILLESMDNFPESQDLDVLDCLAYCLQMLASGEPMSEEDARSAEEGETREHELRSALTGY